MTEWTERRIQNALTERNNVFDFTRYASVPNVAWSLLSHGEADLVCLSKSRVFHEVEIKVTKSDLRADRKKFRAHENAIIAYTWFAVPPFLEAFALEQLEERYGLIVVKPWPEPNTDRHFTHIVRRPTKYTGPGARKPTEREIERFYRAGIIRMWSRRTGG